MDSLDCPVLHFGASPLDTTTFSPHPLHPSPLLPIAFALNTRVVVVNDKMLARSALRNGPARVVARQNLRRTTTVAGSPQALPSPPCHTVLPGSRDLTFADVLVCTACCVELFLLFRSCQLSILHHGRCQCCNSCCRRVNGMVLSSFRPRSICHDPSRRRVSFSDCHYVAIQS